MSIHPSFELIKEEEITELNTTGRLFRHKETGAELLSLENEDENKVFGITFRTPPEDSTGVPHILEHAVLNGSRKYPVKEPFVELIKGSLKTFLNAFTYPDKTCYPVASQNVQDFYNLIDVYLDAVFYPRITPHIFQQEGWHYELEDLEDSMVYKGVVFNEMKGAYSSPDSLLHRYSQQVLFPDTTYGVDSGGDPETIPTLTYEQFKNFHETYYHPSNARIYFYGDDDPNKRLELIEEYLKDFSALTVESDVPLQSRFSEPQRLTFPYDAEEEEGAKKGYLTVNWLLPETDDPEQKLSLAILAYILVGTPASPLRKALIDSELGEDLAGVGLEQELRQLYFSTGLKGIDGADAEQVERLILDTLDQLVTEGLDPHTVEAAVNTIEFRLRENNTGAFPQGLLLMLRALTNWLYEGDPLEPLAFEAPLTALKARLATQPDLFERLIERHLGQNPHRVTLILEPDPTLRQRQDAAEAEKLAQMQANMTEAEQKAVIENTRQLKAMQERPDPPEALATIPTLTLDDLDKEIKIVPRAVSQTQGATVLYHDLFTNGIVYLDLGFNLHTLPQDLLPYASLFGDLLLKIGTETEDFVKLSQRIGSKTGGIRAAAFTSAVLDRPEGQAWLFLRGKATVPQSDSLLAILKDVLLSIELDNPARFKQILLEAKAGQETRLIPAGHNVVDTRLRANFNEADWAEEQMNGLNYLFFIRDLLAKIDEDWPAVVRRLQDVRRTLLNTNAMLCNVTLDAENWQRFEPRLAAFLEALPTQPMSPAHWLPDPGFKFEGLTIPAKVNYVGKGANLYELGYQFHGSALVVNNFLRTSWLWEKVRVQGGAYGGFCRFDPHSGVLNYLSYRDPNLLETLAIYDQTAQFLRQVDLTRETVTRSIIGTIGQMDAYQLPDAKGYSSMLRYLLGLSNERRQQWRDEVLATTAAEFRAFAEVLEQANQRGLVAVLGSQEGIEAANAAQGDGWLAVQKVL